MQELKKKTFIVMRGIPGSGKSTRAKIYKETEHDSEIVSADFFWLNDTGDYNFDVKRITEAHSWCFGKFLNMIEQDKRCIILDNVNAKLEHFQNYVKVAEMFGYDIIYHEIYPETVEDLKKCVDRNIHDVPMDIVYRMAHEFDEVAGSFYIRSRMQ